MAQSALFLRDSVKVHLESNGLLYVGGNMSVQDSGDSSKIENYGKIEITGDLTNLGSGNLFEPRLGEIEFRGISDQRISGSFAYNSMRINNGSGVSVNSGTQTIYNTLYLDNGTFNTNNSLVLNSDAIRTARVHEITGGSISGQVTIERWIDSAKWGGYRFLSAPAQGVTINQWKDDIILIGFTGSHYPNHSFNSIAMYNETILGHRDSGYYYASDVNDILGFGEGFQVYLGGKDIKIDIQGTLYTGVQNLPVTFTDDPLVSDEENGWQMVGNPYPSGIDWDSPSWVKSNMEDAIYIWDPINGVYTSYAGGVGINGGSRYIASSQSFWVKSNGPSPVLQANEGIKITQDPNFIESTQKNIIRLILSDQSISDETVIRFKTEATDHFDTDYDARKFLSSKNVPNIYTSYAQKDYGILALPDDKIMRRIPLNVRVPQTKVYALNVNLELDSAYNCILLYDNLTGRIESLRDSSVFHFLISDTLSTPRFEIRVGELSQITITDANCYGDSGKLALNNDWNTSIDYQWKNTSNTSWVNDTIYQGKDSLSLVAGNYLIQFNKNLCFSQRQSFTINEPNDLLLITNSLPDSLNDGKAWVDVSGGISPYDYHWSDSYQQQNDTAYKLVAGTYTVLVKDFNGCIDSAQIIVNKKQVVALNENQKNGFKIYPIPVTEVLNIDLFNHEYKKVELRTIQGQLLKSYQLQHKKERLDFSWLKSGVYILIVEGENNRVIETIEKL